MNPAGRIAAKRARTASKPFFMLLSPRENRWPPRFEVTNYGLKFARVDINATGLITRII
jgi:hypothetical protein